MIHRSNQFSLNGYFLFFFSFGVKELEDALREAQLFNAEIQDLLLWLNDIDGALSMSKPVGGLPETAHEQLQRFMEVFNDLETNRPQGKLLYAS